MYLNLVKYKIFFFDKRIIDFLGTEWSTKDLDIRTDISKMKIGNYLARFNDDIEDDDDYFYWAEVYENLIDYSDSIILETKNKINKIIKLFETIKTIDNSLFLISKK